MDGLIPVRLVGGTGTTGLWGLVCARGAQQQAAQREERQGEESGEDDLMHAGTIARAARGRQGRGLARLPRAHST